MLSHEALEEAIGRDTVAHAKRMGLSASTVGKWKEPSLDYSDSGAYNPLDRVETIIETALSKGNLKGAYAPIHYLCSRFSHVAISLPSCGDCIKDVTESLMQVISEFGHLAAASSEALMDRKISKEELAKIEKESYELIQHVQVFLASAKEIAK